MFANDDPRRATYATRSTIGFADEWRSWQDAPAQLSQGKLEIQGHPVMEDWETPYMEELAAIATQNGGRVLEVGFGLGISATYVQSHPIGEHVIIEANRDVFERLTAFARSARHTVTPWFGFWQDVVPQLDTVSFDGILFDTYPLQAAEVHTNHFPFFQHAYRLLKPGGVLTYYSDEVTELSPPHIATLQAAGFQEISYKVCPVTPPTTCLYWTSHTIIAPIIRKT